MSANTTASLGATGLSGYQQLIYLHCGPLMSRQTGLKNASSGQHTGFIASHEKCKWRLALAQ